MCSTLLPGSETLHVSSVDLCIVDGVQLCRCVPRSAVPVSLQCCMAAELYRCSAVWLQSFIAAVLYGCSAVWLQCCMATDLYRCSAVWLQCCMAAVLYGCSAVWLQCCMAAALYRGRAEPHDFCTVSQVVQYFCKLNPSHVQ